MAFIWQILGVLSFCAFSILAAFPPIPEAIIIVNSTLFPGRSISYKATTICETTKDVKSYSGYVNLPANSSEGRHFDVHTYFWFFEARHDPKNAPLSVWLQGGPGVPSITAAVGENGPCLIMNDSTSTELNPWSWNDKVNMLYIDQPVQVGFSYNTLVNGTIDEVPTPFVYKPADFSSSPLPDTNLTLLTGTFATPRLAAAPNTTVGSAPVFWDLMQTWVQEFPDYRPSGDKFSIWSESYGGHYGPQYAGYIDKQNGLIAAGNIMAPAIQLHLDTIGLVNACIDIDTQVGSYPEFAINNTYGIQAINETQYASAIASLDTCRNMTAKCRTITDEQDPHGAGNVSAVNKACLDADLYCFGKMHDGYTKARNLFDITAPALESFPPKWAAGYLNRAEIQQALGVPLNFTGNSAVIASGFNLTGDFVRGHGLEFLGTLLDKGVKIAFMYGDRDYQCNWLGGEAVSLALKANVSTSFKNAGYVNIETNSSYVGGLVRQFGNLSFSRVFQAGHEVPYYQPETAYQIFNRVMFNTDVATGKNPASDTATIGSSSAFTKSDVHVNNGPVPCYLWDILETCTTAQKQILMNGTAIVENFILVGQKQVNGTGTYFNGTAGGVGGTASPSSSPGTSAAHRYLVFSIGLFSVSVAVVLFSHTLLF